MSGPWRVASRGHGGWHVGVVEGGMSGPWRVACRGHGGWHVGAMGVACRGHGWWHVGAMECPQHCLIVGVPEELKNEENNFKVDLLKVECVISAWEEVEMDGSQLCPAVNHKCICIIAPCTW